MSKTNVGANLVFARRTKIGIKPMFENEFETITSDIGSQTIVVRRANIRFAPTLVSDIGWITTIYPKTYDRLLISYLTPKFKDVPLSRPYLLTVYLFKRNTTLCRMLNLCMPMIYGNRCPKSLNFHFIMT